MPNSLTDGYVNAITLGQFSILGASYVILGMKTVFETRKQRLINLKTKHGSWAALNRKIGWEDTNPRLSQIASGSIRSTRDKPYVMGDSTARQIEKALGLVEGWMDTPLTYLEMTGKEDPRQEVLKIMERVPEDQWDTAKRLLMALVPPASMSNNAPSQRQQ